MEKSPSKGADDSLVSIIFLRNNQYPVHLPISCKSFPSTDKFQLSPFKGIGNLCLPCLKIGQGHHRVMIYIYIVVLKPLMFHAKFS